MTLPQWVKRSQYAAQIHELCEKYPEYAQDVEHTKTAEGRAWLIAEVIGYIQTGRFERMVLWHK